MGGRADGASAILVASSPSSLIDSPVRRVMGTEMAEQMQQLRRGQPGCADRRGGLGEVRGRRQGGCRRGCRRASDLQNKRAELRTQMAGERELCHAAARSAGRADPPDGGRHGGAGSIAPIPTVGWAVVPNARCSRIGIMPTYPGAVDWWRAPGPASRPSERARPDIMIGSDMGLGTPSTPTSRIRRHASASAHDVAGGTPLRPRPRHGVLTPRPPGEESRFAVANRLEPQPFACSCRRCYSVIAFVNRRQV